MGERVDDLGQDDVDRLIRQAGVFLLRNSSEGTFDLDITLREIGRAYGARVEALVNMEGMSYVVTHGDGRQRSGIVHAQPALERLDQLADFKDLTTRISTGALTAAEAGAALERLEAAPSPYPVWARFVGVVLFAAGFAPSMQANWRQVVALAASNGIAAPAFMSALAYYDGYRSPRLPANLLQGQRDFFGAHTYERTDAPRGKFFHTDWPEKDRPQIDIIPGSGGGH